MPEDMSKWSGLPSLASLHEEMGRLLDSFFRRPEPGVPPWTPLVDVTDDGSNLLVRVELPGVRQEDLDVLVASNLVRIRGFKRRDRAETERLIQGERCYGDFARTVSLPTTVDCSRASAKLKDGILTLTLPPTRRRVRREIHITIG